MFKQMMTDIFNIRSPASENVEHIDEEMARLAESLEAKRKIAIERMGEKWILHPSHHVKKQDIAANSLGFKTA